MSDQHSPDHQQQHQQSRSDDPGIEITGQYPAETDVTVRPNDNEAWPPSKLHRELYDADDSELTDRLREGARSVGRRAASVAKLWDILDENGVDALDGSYADLCIGVMKGHADDALELARTTRQLGGNTSHDVRTSLDDIRGADPALFAAAEGVTPTIAISMDGFTEVRNDQREDVLSLVRAYARGCRVVLVASPVEQGFLWLKHREELPGSVKDDCNPRLGEQANPAAVEAHVEDARDALDADSKPVAILRAVADETSETLSYNALAAEMGVGRGTIRNHVTQRLQPHALVNRFDHLGTAHVSLSYIGQQFLDALDREIGRQSRFDGCVNSTGNPNDNSRVTPPTWEGRHSPAAETEGGAERGGSGGGAADDRDSHRPRLPHYHQVRDAARHRYAAAARSAIEGGVSLVNHPIPEKDDRAEPHWYYEEKADCLYIGAEFDNPMEWWTCVALALTSPKTFRHILTPERFETGKLGDMLANHTDLLRDSRCLGYLADSNATAEDYTDALLEAAEDLRDLTKDLYHDNYENKNRFRGDITREALGLAGTMVHLLDLAGVEIVREARIPRFSQDFKESQKADLAKTLAIGASIQSKYGEFAAFRQLFEDREEKREGAIPPSVDAEDPFGECIGSFVLVGKSVEGFADQLRRRLSAQETHDDAPEFAVEVPVEVATDRQHVAHAVREMCRQKSIRPIREATSMLAALTGTPYDVTEAIHSLAPERRAPTRELHLDEVRYALGTLDAKRIVPAMGKPSLSKVVHTLLVAETPLTQSELAEQADVSARSIRTHTDRLAAFDFARETDAGWRFALPLRGDVEHDERGENILPWFVATGDDEQDRECEQETLVRDVISEAVSDLLDSERYGDADDPVGGALFGPPGERIPALIEAWEWLDPWVSMVGTLVGQHVESGPPSTTTAIVGEPPEQVSIVTAAGGG
jgi:hypothetical protein